MVGLIALVAALAVASLIGVAFRRRSGRFSRTYPGPHSGHRPGSRPAADDGADPARVLTPADLGADLGERATLVQFSTEFCAYCGPAHKLLGEVAATRPGVTVIEIDAAERMDLTRRLGVFATPTILVLGPDGTIVSRSSGQPKRAAVLAALGGVS